MKPPIFLSRAKYHPFRHILPKASDILHTQVTMEPWIISTFRFYCFHFLGVKYLEECPREPKLPIYLLVGGCFGGLKLLLLLCEQARKLRDDDDETIHDDSELLTMTKVAHVCLSLFLCVWFGFGNFWLFGVGIPKFKAPLHEPRNWCDRVVFTFTFWQIVICYILLAIVFVFGTSFCICFTVVRCKKDVEKGWV